nr:putative Ig domain-containing protein [Leptospira weilii]
MTTNRNCQFSNYTATNLPTGLSISSSTGAISGIPTVAGANVVTLSVTFKPNNTPAVTLTKIMNVTVHTAGEPPPNEWTRSCKLKRIKHGS